MITIIIPYFQREPGVLAKALNSIGKQQNCTMPVHVIVVDDESPVPAQSEVEAATVPPFISVRVMTQKNGGPGAARNAGLNAVPDNTLYVAFLDSDDEWSIDHLARSEAALNLGFDFYFADLYQLGQIIGAFARGGRLLPTEHPLLVNAIDGLHAYKGDMFDQILRGNVVGTPTVVYRWKKFSDVRFRIEFTTAGEDYLFWMELAARGARVVFSSQVETTCGKGVNVFSGSGWGTEMHLTRVHHEIRYRQAVSKGFPLNTLQRQHIASDLKRLRKAFLRDLLHRIAHYKGIPKNLLFEHAKADPATFIAFPANLFLIMLKR